MTVDSEVIFATAEADRQRRPRVRGVPRLDGRRLARRAPPGAALPRARSRPAALGRHDPPRALLRLDGARRSRSPERYTGVQPAQARARRGNVCSRVKGAAPSATTASRPIRPTRPTRCPPSAHPHEGAFCLERLAALAARLASLGLQRAVPLDRRTLLAEPLADEVLERRPRPSARVEHPVDLPLGQQRRILAAARPPSR